MKSIRFLLPFFVLWTCQTLAQTPSTEIWLVDVSNKAGKMVFGTPARITENDYYDNQPSFSQDGNFVWYASMPDTVQSDIYEYNIRKKTTRQLTSTPESEFQPQQVPSNKDLLSVVRVDTDKGQRFYEISIDGTDLIQSIPNEDSVAYYCWMNDTTLGAYMLNGGGGILEQFDMIPQQAIILMNGGFGRCIARVPGSNNLSYIQKGSDGKWTLIRYDMDSQERLPLIEMPAGVEDYCWAPDGKVYCGDKGKLFVFDSNKEGSKWTECADFSKIIGDFYRMSFSPKGDYIALVSFKGKKP